ncbi:MAG: O-antigen ligase family protein [Bdellovibrionales bacterium]|nr:O-antigen ligase family protein [Bdellovibrionales bacterium]
MGDARWLLLLYAYSYVLRKYLKPGGQKHITIICLVTIVVGTISLLQFYFGWDFTRKREILAAFGQYYRASGLFNHPLTFAYSIGMVWLLLVGLTIENFKQKGQHFWIYFISSFFALVGLVTSLSRGAWAAGGVALVILVFLSYKKAALKSVIALFLVGLGLYFTNSTIQSRFNDMTTISGNESNRLRTVLWRANWEIFKDHPIIGVGLSQNKNYLLEYYNRLGFQGENIVSHAHNNYLQILAGTGLIGFFFYMSFCVYFLALSFFTYKKLDAYQVFYRGLVIGIFSAQIFLHLGGLTQCNFTDGEVNHLLVFLWGVLLAISYQLRAKKLEAT